MFHRGIASHILDVLQMTIDPVEQETRQKRGVKSLKPAYPLVQERGLSTPVVTSKFSIHSDEQVTGVDHVFLVVLASVARFGSDPIFQITNPNERHSLR